ncbi:MAG: DNA (cytosine-5-)-methyltransferase [Chryseobacterium sp.]|nr:MAG: DNA (cytosine-5-)-methyltransferase [Chryseobacterium sp.]
MNKIRMIEHAFFPIAEQHTPEGSETIAVVQQWVHALAFEQTIFASAKVDRTLLIDLLKELDLYNTPEDFRQLVEEYIYLKEHWNNNLVGFSFIDLFAGIGGMRQGFERAGGRCVFSSEFERNAQNTYSQNYGEFPFGDITKIDPSDIPDHDVLVGGFPCQPFSHAGKKLGIEDTRGTLFHNIALIIQTKRPLTVLLENVKGLISHDEGYTLKVVLTTLINEGYHCNIPDEIIRGADIKALKREARRMIMRSKDFGVPQNRQRIYIVLWRNDLPVTFEYPNPDPVETRVGQILEDDPAELYTISDRLWAGHQSRKQRNKIEGKGFGYNMVNADSPYTGTISARYYKDGSEILIAQEGKNPRKLTLKEAGRLQGFPDNFILNPSKVQSYKQFGNSVTVPVVEAVAHCIREQIIIPNR